MSESTSGAGNKQHASTYSQSDDNHNVFTRYIKATLHTCKPYISQLRWTTTVASHAPPVFNLSQFSLDYLYKEKTKGTEKINLNPDHLQEKEGTIKFIK